MKRLRDPRFGTLTLEYSSFAVDGRPDLGLIVYDPATAADRAIVEALRNGSPAIAAE